MDQTGETAFIDFTMGKTLEVDQDPKGGIQGISMGSISGFEDGN